MILRARDIEAAESCADLDPRGWSTAVDVNADRVESELRRHRTRLRTKLRGEPGNTHATTHAALRQIRLPRNWGSRSLATRTAVLAHELVHVRQRVSVIRYAAARYRWHVEVPAYRESLRIWRAHDPRIDLEATIDRLIEQFEAMYLILDPRAHAEARRIWLLDWR